jgi:inhibitor of cysteine peptidase
MNTRKIIRTISSVLLLLTLVACSQTSKTESTISVGAGDAGKTITLSQGNTLIVTLDGNTTTGYSWLMQTMNPALLKQVGDPTYIPESNQVGASGKISLKFQAIRTGQATLILNYMRSFEKDIAPLKAFEVMVVVK